MTTTAQQTAETRRETVIEQIRAELVKCEAEARAQCAPGEAWEGEWHASDGDCAYMAHEVRKRICRKPLRGEWEAARVSFAPGCGGAHCDDPSDLDELLVAVQAGDYAERDMTSLPTYGGEEPDDTHGIFSWDAGRVLVQRSSGWEIVPRDEGDDDDHGVLMDSDTADEIGPATREQSEASRGTGTAEGHILIDESGAVVAERGPGVRRVYVQDDPTDGDARAARATARAIYDAAGDEGWISEADALRIAGRARPDCHGRRTMADLAARLGCAAELKAIIDAQ